MREFACRTGFFGREVVNADTYRPGGGDERRIREVESIDEVSLPRREPATKNSAAKKGAAKKGPVKKAKKTKKARKAAAKKSAANG